jgi:hypothetical protein
VTQTDVPPPDRPHRRSRRRRVSLAAALLLSAGLGTVWMLRQPIVTRFVDRELDRRGVAARYRITDLGLGRQRLTDVVIGDPRRPDLIADWIETRTGIGLAGPYLVGVKAGRVRLNARLADGRVSLGAIDRLLPPPSGKPFALPALRVAVEEARVRLATPYGAALLRIAGQGRLDDGFAGTITADAPTLAIGGCWAQGVRAAVRIAITAARPHLDGPVAARRLACDDGLAVAAPRADLDLRLSAALDRWQGRVKLATAAATRGAIDLAAATADLDIAGSAARSEGHVVATLRRPRTPQGTAAAATLDGDYAIDRRLAFTGRAHLTRATLAPALIDQVAPLETAAAGTPVAPLAARLGQALVAAGRALDADARLDIGEEVAVSQIAVDAASGARLTLDGRIVVADGAPRLPPGLKLVAGGGGLPRFALSLSQAHAAAPIRGRAVVDPYAAGAARLALAPVLFTATPRGDWRATTRATLSGPLGDGRVEGLAMPMSFTGTRGRIAINPACTPVAFDRLAIAGLALDPARLSLCPTGDALVSVANGGVAGGARLGATRLSGRLGGTPLTLAATGASVRLADRGFAVAGVEALLGAPDRQSRLAIADLTGRIAGATVTGTFAEAGGRIGNVPLLLSGAAGEWTLNRGILSLTGALTVGDEAIPPRFRPLAARQVDFRLAGGAITATGVLHEPATGTRVATVAIAHRLADGRGHADLAVPALTFGEGFQPDLLTPLTFGVVADVRGRVDGSARIDWNGQGVTSTGTFGTDALDLAAAFGPVTGIATRLRFDDLLALHTPPGQVATVRTVNPGIAVQDGTIRYQILNTTQVQVEGARWPFAGGALTLDPSRLDFGESGQRRLTFRVAGARADQFLDQFDFANLNATGTFDGVLPMIFDDAGGRIENGRLSMRAGGGTIAYVGALGQEQLGTWGDLAFQALKSLRYRSLDVTLNGALAGEMVTDVRFAGVSQGAGAKSNFLVRRLQRLPLVFNVRIKAPFRGLLDSAQSFYDPSRLVQRNLPALLEQQNRAGRPAPAAATPVPIQPPASENKR